MDIPSITCDPYMHTFFNMFLADREMSVQQMYCIANTTSNMGDVQLLYPKLSSLDWNGQEANVICDPRPPIGAFDGKYSLR